MNSDYKASKEAFVSGATGSTISHVNFISAAALCSIALHASVRSRLSTPRFLSLATEWFLLVLPLLLSMTLFASRPLFLSFLLLIPTGILLALPARQNNTPLPPASEIIRSPSPSHAIDFSDAPEGNVPAPIQAGSRIVISPLPALTVYRAHMLLMTFLAILAVDFPIFPRALAKCETFGVSMMDLGVGSFVFSQGVVSAIPILKEPTHLTASIPTKSITALKKTLPLFFLGVVRVLTVKGSEYPEHESEYGTHWNFFFTMAFLPLLEISLHPAMIHLPISLLGFMVALSHQMALSFTPLQTYTLHAQRTNLIGANKEGLVSLMGYLAIHLLGLSTGTVILPPSPSDFRRQQHHLRQKLHKQQKSQVNITVTAPTPISPPSSPASARYDRFGADHNAGMAREDRVHTKPLQRQDAKTATELFSYAILWWTCLGMCFALSEGGGVSRRLSNLPYVIWVAAYNSSFILCYLLLGMFLPSAAPPGLFRRPKHPGGGASETLEPPMPDAVGTLKRPSRGASTPPALLDAVNRNGLVLFLVANVATGLVNLSVQTMYTSDALALLVLSVYSFGLCAVAWAGRETRIWRF